MIEQKVVQVANDAASINASLTTENADGWVMGYSILSGSDILLFYSKTVTPS